MAVVDTYKNTRTFIEESWTELQKVTWPDRDQLQSATIVVVLFTTIVSLIIVLMDRVVGFVIQMIMSIFGA